MRYKPNSLVQQVVKADIPTFVVNYFNGRFLMTANNEGVTALMEANDRAQEQFNCVVSVEIEADQAKFLRPICKDAIVGNRVVVYLNPQMASIFVGLAADRDLVYRFETGWKGAEILCDVCHSGAAEVQAFGDRLHTLMEELRERREAWDDQTPPPKGYTARD